MPRVLVTGMSGTGKSAALQMLGKRGHRVVDTDTDQWSHWVTLPDGIALLSAPVDVLLARIAARTSNPYGNTPANKPLSCGTSPRQNRRCARPRPLRSGRARNAAVVVVRPGHFALRNSDQKLRYGHFVLIAGRLNLEHGRR
jgi:hypothetical protein